MSFVDRLFGWWRDPNPIVRKELLAVLRTPLYVRSVVVALIAVGITVVTSAVSIADSSDSSEAGKILFQLFFGGTFLVMSFVGPTFGATMIVQEREARTFDALSLSALGPRRIVMGKLLAVFIAMAFIPLVSVPMLGVATLFGGVTLGHLIVSTLYVLAFGAVGVTFGVAVSAVSDATRKAVGATVPLSVGGALFLGTMLSVVGHDFARHHALSFEGPFFFADAYFALPFDRFYLLWLVLIPLWVVGAPASLFYAVAYGGLMEPSQDRTLPLKRWAAATAPLTLALIYLGARWTTAGSSDREGWTLAYVTLTTLAATSMLFAFVGAPVTPSRRAERESPGVIARTFMPPSRVASVWFVVMLGALASLFAPLVLVGRAPEMLIVGLWAAAYIAALSGIMGAFSMRGATGPTTARVAGAVTLFVTFVGVWLIALLMGFGSHGNSLRNPSVVLALSPSWAVLAAGDVFLGTRDSIDELKVRTTMLGGAVFYGLVAMVTLAMMTGAKSGEKKA